MTPFFLSLVTYLAKHEILLYKTSVTDRARNPGVADIAGGLPDNVTSAPSLFTF